MTQANSLEDQTTVDPQTVVRASALPAEESGSDWLAIGLGIVALIALLGLIPLWYFVYTAYAG